MLQIILLDDMENSSRVGNMAMVRTQHVQKVGTDRGPVDSDLEYGQMDVRSSKGDEKDCLVSIVLFL